MENKDIENQEGLGSPERQHEEVITTHMNADFDALASMIAARKLYPNATLAFPGSQERNLRNFFLHSTSYLFNFTKIKHLDFDRIKRLILVDTRQKSRIGRFADLAQRPDVDIHIYDHHHDSHDDIHGRIEIVREVGATTTILTHFIKDRGIRLSSDEATIMSLGIHEDTGSFTFSSTTPEDYRAAAWLAEQGANANLISDMLTRELTAEQVWLLSDLTKSATSQVINGIDVVICKVTRDEYIGDFAVLVHKFMEMENLSVIIALAQMEDKIYLVARSRVEEVNAAEIALAFGGGGHPQAASATIKKKTLIQVEKSLQALLRNRVIPQKRARDMMTSPVIHISPDGTIQEAATLMTKFNINVLLVTDDQANLVGYITRQVVEKAVYFGLGNIRIEEYTNIEFPTVGADASLKEVQDRIIEDKVRILPVTENGKMVGVITRTDLLNILVGGPVLPDFLYESRHASHFEHKKNIAAMLKERLPRRVITLLKDFGYVADMMGYQAFLVGGLLRDILLKRENLDVDIVIEGDGIKFAQEFAADHGVRLRSHKKFGTVVMIFPDGFKVDVATARIEYYNSPAAPPSVEVSSLKMDLYRRDFTINTLAVKLNKRDYGTLMDYFGAQKDIREKVIRVLHNLSFVEDPTRVLRAIRFEQRFGFKIGKLTLSLMKNAVAINCFKGLSGRRLLLELKLLLMEPEPIKTVERMEEFNLLQVLSPAILLTPELKNLLEDIRGVLFWFDLLYLDESYDLWKVYFLGLTSHMDAKSLQAMVQRLQMSDVKDRKMIRQRLEIGAVLDQLYKFQEQSNYALYKLLSQYDTEILLYMMARANNRTIKRLVSQYFTKLKGIRCLLKGKDLKAMGFPPGPLFREILDALLEARINNEVGTREDEIAFVKKQYGKSRESETEETLEPWTMK
ncbi:MAG: CBS domain-containing protein [Deltaproteobacteria bacterium]|nr:CBS domain-containing protein [Deltaproteobacteria bacterium]